MQSENPYEHLRGDAKGVHDQCNDIQSTLFLRIDEAARQRDRELRLLRDVCDHVFKYHDGTCECVICGESREC
jgi:hypothetical protein